MKNLSVLYQREGKNVLAFLQGSLVNLAALNLKAALPTMVNPNDNLVIDLTEVTDVDTTGLNALYQTRMSCDINNIDMVLKFQKSHPLLNLLNLTRSENHFEIRYS